MHVYEQCYILQLVLLELVRGHTWQQLTWNVHIFSSHSSAGTDVCLHHMLPQLMPGVIVASKSEEVQLAELMIYHSHTHTTWTIIDFKHMHADRINALPIPKRLF